MASNSQLTAEMLADLLTPHEINLSPNGQYVVYSLRSDACRHDRWTSEIWLAEVDKKNSARQLTKGSYDMSPSWASDSESVVFISDKKKEGANSVLYYISVNGGEAVPLTPVDNQAEIMKCAFSPDGKYIAYISNDEKSAEQRSREEKKDDPIVYGVWQFSRLRYIEVGKETTTPIALVSDNCQITDFSWSPDSNQIAYATARTPAIESAFTEGQDLKIVNMADSKTILLQHFEGQLVDLTWHGSDLFWRSTYTPGNILSSWCLYGLSISNPEIKWTRRAYGKDRDASPFAWGPGIRTTALGLVVQVQYKLNDQIQIHDTEEIIFDELTSVLAWDATIANSKRILALVMSNPSSPFELYSLVDGRATCLSSHGSHIAKIGLADAEPVYAVAQDGTPINGVLWIPRDADRSAGPLPTIVEPHGGPCSRITESFSPMFFHWTPWLVSQGYCVLAPNYGGSTGHGDRFAARVRENSGQLDYSDMIDLLKSTIRQGIVDEKRCGIGGWSAGGYLSYVSVTRDDIFHFSAAVCGAGGVSWDLGIGTSDTPIFSIQLAGKAPWQMDDGGKDIQLRRGSPIYNMSNVKTPVLILHGENDDRVHISHARSFHWGCLDRGYECEMVIYPREGHGGSPPFERMHYIDTLKRMAKFYAKHLKMEEISTGPHGGPPLSKAEEMLNR